LCNGSWSFAQTLIAAWIALLSVLIFKHQQYIIIEGLLQASCSEQQVRQYLANLRSNLRSFIQRAQRNAAGKASGLPNGAPGAPAAQPQRSATGQPPLASHQHCGQCIVQPNTTLHDCTLYRGICMTQACHQAVQISASLGICV